MIRKIGVNLSVICVDVLDILKGDTKFTEKELKVAHAVVNAKGEVNGVAWNNGNWCGGSYLSERVSPANMKRLTGVAKKALTHTRKQLNPLFKLGVVIGKVD